VAAHRFCQLDCPLRLGAGRFGFGVRLRLLVRFGFVFGVGLRLLVRFGFALSAFSGWALARHRCPGGHLLRWHTLALGADADCAAPSSPRREETACTGTNAAKRRAKPLSGDTAGSSREGRRGDWLVSWERAPSPGQNVRPDVAFGTERPVRQAALLAQSVDECLQSVACAS
jgi:hypothetical protein